MKEEYLLQHETEMDELQVNLNRLQTVTSFLHVNDMIVMVPFL